MAQEKVLLVIDNTVFSEKAAAFTAKLLKANPDFSATLLYVGFPRDVLPDVPGAGWISRQEFEALVQKEADAAFKKALTVIRSEGFGVQTVLKYGDPVEVVTRLVSQEGYTLVVLGGRETEDRLNYVLSSTVYRLIHLLSIPLVIVK